MDFLEDWSGEICNFNKPTWGISLIVTAALTLIGYVWEFGGEESVIFLGAACNYFKQNSRQGNVYIFQNKSVIK